MQYRQTWSGTSGKPGKMDPSGADGIDTPGEGSINTPGAGGHAMPVAGGTQLPGNGDVNKQLEQVM